jgi:hypothetical protein
MPENNKKQSANNKKNVDGKFHSKHVKHDPQAESARAVYGLNQPKAENKNDSH